MMSILFYIGIALGVYVLGMVLVFAWDAKFGWGEDPETINSSPLSFEDLILWPLGLLLLPFFLISEWATKTKASRLNKAIEKKRALAKLENERRIELSKLEQELFNEREDQNNSQFVTKLHGTSGR